MVKFSRLYCCLTTLLFLSFFSSNLYAQTFNAGVEEHFSLILPQQFSTFQVFKLDATKLDKYVHSNAEAPAELNIGGHNWRLDLTLNPILSENYSLRVGTQENAVTTYPKHKIAFKGYELNGGGRIRLTLHGEFMYGFVEEGNERYYIEPLWYFEPDAPRDLFVLYPRSAVSQLPEDACGVTETQTELEHLEDAISDKKGNQGARSMDCYELELAIASDESMLNSYGSAGGVEDHNIGVINSVEGDYTGNFNNDIDFVIVTQFVSGGDPWSPSTDAGTLLGSFRDWGNAGNFGVAFDLGELWTDRDFNGGTVGIAYLAGLCNSVKYHCLQDFTNNAEHLRCMTSHEIGHNFSSNHDGNCPPGDFIMCPFVSSSTSWSDQSTTAINNYMQAKINSGCLTACGPPPPPLIAGFDFAPNPGCKGEAVSFTDLSSGNITNWAWIFQGGNPATSNQQNPSVTWNSAGTKNITLTITGAGGSNAITQTIEILPLAVASYTYSVNGLVVTFDNTSINAVGYEWDFGDGSFSTDEDPIHEYTEAGIYTVVLTASNECGSSTRSFNVNTAPTADFSANPLTGCAPLSVTFDNLSSTNATSFLWTFVGASPASSTVANPTISYNSAGTFSVTLKATNVSGSNTITRTNYIVVNGNPAANFNFTVNGSVASFTNASIGLVTSYLWDFGDGQTSTQASPTHTYANSGTYDVLLTVSNDCGTSTKTKSVTIVALTAPTVAFVANPATGCAPLTVSFTNNTTGAVTYNWSFPGANPATSTAANPTVVYNNAGVYTVTLTATNAIGTSSATATVTVNTVPVAAFTDTITNDTTVLFTNTSTGATSYSWSFGDGETSTLANPEHDYPALDSIYNYIVIMQAINSCGTISDTQIVTIITDPTARFTATPTTGCAPLSVQFNNTSTPNATAFLWRFPGGTPDTSVVKKPLVVYNTPGTYPVTLIAINSSGRDTFTRTNYIVVNSTPVVGFTSVPNGLTVAFTNTTTGGNSYSWDFGDGGSSTLTNPSHTYLTDGTYTVVLTATNACGTVTKPQTVTVITAPSSNFQMSANSGCAPLNVQFTNTSTPNATTYDWQFPGGNPSSSSAQTPPAVSYDLPGNYTVTLTVSNSAGSSTSTQTISVNAGPTANFSATVSALTATFTNSSTNGITYEWDFGDGGSSTASNPSHSYDADGTYTVVLTATNACGTSTFTQNVLITTAPGAGFSVSTTSGCAALTVNLTDISSGNPVSWAWDLPGGTPSSSTAQNPTVQYFTPGTYDVTLVVTSVGGSTSSFAQPGIITVLGAPGAGFTANINGATASFTSTATNASSYIWNFGDGSNSTEENPTHIYTNDGVFTVTQSVTNNCGTTIFEQTVTIATPPVAAFTSSLASGCAPFAVQFANTSSSNATAYSWEFPGGNPATSTLANPSVTWNTAGVYVVTLTATNAAGSSTSTSTVTVNASPTAGFTYQLGGLTAVFSNTSASGLSYTWDFGDGSAVSTEANPSHTYTQMGNYVVTLSTMNECGTVTVTQTLIVQGNPPVPGISASNTIGCVPLTVQFSDQSAGAPSAWSWTFQGGNPATSTLQNPTVVYATAGTYDVKLEVTNAFGPATQIFPAYITVQETPTGEFTFVSNQTTVTFTSADAGATSYTWNFGDGGSSTEQNPSHTYNAPGTYTVSLNTTNSCGSSIVEHTVVITTGTGEAAWIEGLRLFPNPNTGVFTVELKGQPQHEVEFTLYNALGQTIKRETADFASGSLLRTFDYGQIASGFYTLRIQAAGEARFVKLSVNR